MPFRPKQASEALIDGLGACRLVESFGSPLYALDLRVIVERARYLRTIFRPPMYGLLYSAKANPSVAIMERLRSLGLRCDACSIGDLELAELAGWSGQEISLTGVGLSTDELREAVRRRAWINVDSLTELESYCEIAPGRRLGLRVETGVEAGFHPHCRSGGPNGKTGILLDEVADALTIARSQGNTISTLHTHIGSGIMAAGPYLEGARRLLSLARDLREVDTINLGGGLGVPYDDGEEEFPVGELEAGLTTLLAEFTEDSGRRVQILLEPGEYLVAEAGFLVCTVRVTKRRRGRNPIAIVDASANLLPATQLYGTEYPLSAALGPRDVQEVWDVFGCTNQAGELLATARSLPPLRSGDVLVFGTVGAYASCRASQFNELPRPAEVAVDGGTVRLSRHPETVQDLSGIQLGHGGETAELHDVAAVPPRAREANARLCGSPWCFELQSFVDDAAIGARIDLGGTGVEFGEQEQVVVAASWAVVLAQHSLSENIHVFPPVPESVAEQLEPLLQLLYDVRCSCDRRPVVSAPRFPRGRDLDGRGSSMGGSGTLLLFSGGADSTLLMKLLQGAGDRVEALHFRVNPHVEGDEERAARELADRLGVPLTVVDIRMPGFERVGRLHSRSYGIYPYYNSIPHGRDLLLATIGALIAAKRGFRRLAIGAEKDTFEHRFEYQGRQVHRADVVSEHGFFLLSQFLRECVAPDVELIAPLTGCSQYVCRRMMIKHYPELFALTQSCVWGKSCGMCLKCLSTYLVQHELGLPVKEFLQDMFNDPHHVDLESLVTFPGTPRDLGYENLYHYTLARIAKSDHPARDSYWLRRFAQEKLPHIEGELPFLETACLELNMERVPADLRATLGRLTGESPAASRAVSV